MNTTPSSLQELAEIEIRGRFMSMACDMEMAMLHIMVYCSPDPFNQKRKFYKMFMHEKIQNTIADLKSHKPHLYDKYETDLMQLWDFKEVRNCMAHFIIDWIESSVPLQSFRIVFVNDKELLEEKIYTIEEIKGEITRFRKVALKLGLLAQELMGLQKT